MAPRVIDGVVVPFVTVSGEDAVTFVTVPPPPPPPVAMVISAVPSNETPLIVLAVASLVAVAALPEQDPAVPAVVAVAALPVMLMGHVLE